MDRSDLLRLLIVEADEAFRRQITERLRMENCLILEAPNESEAVKWVESTDVDVALLVLRSSGPKRLSLLKCIKNTRPLTEVILLSSPDEFSLSVSIEAMKVGAFDDLLIPFDVETLVHRIRAAHQQRKTRLEEKSRNYPQERKAENLPA